MKTNDKNVLMEFLSIPVWDTDAVINRFVALPGAIHRRKSLEEQFVYVPGSRSDRVVLVAHADTVWEDLSPDEMKPPSLHEENGIIRNLNGGLGADDRAGCAILWLLKDLGHSLLVTGGEEGGGEGSAWLMGSNPDIADELNKSHQFMVQLDRRNGRDFKCYSVGTPEFRRYIKKTTGYKEPDRESFTDIVTLCRDICGVNLSIGYQDEHCDRESLVVEDWHNTLGVCRRWLAEPSLPVFNLSKAVNVQKEVVYE